jgi:hypothetical protein
MNQPHLGQRGSVGQGNAQTRFRRLFWAYGTAAAAAALVVRVVDPVREAAPWAFYCLATLAALYFLILLLDGLIERRGGP